MGSNKITGLADGTGSNDAVNLGQLNAVVGGIDWKESVELASTANLTLSGEQIIDGILTSGSRILVKDQTTGSENGIYVTGAGAWTRAVDADADAEVTSQLTVAVETGTANSGSMWKVSTADPIVVGTTAIAFVKLDITTKTASLGVQLVGADFRADLLASGGLKLTGNSIGVEPNDFAGAGLIDDGADNLAIDFSTTFNDAKAIAAQDINSVVNGEGASIVGIEDSAGNFAATNVEAALLELYNSISLGGVDYTVGAGGVTKGDLLYISANDTVLPYSTLTASHRGIGIALTTESAAATVKCLANDTVLTGVLTGASAGTPYYWDGTNLTASISATSGAFVWQCGVAKNATDLSVEMRFVKKNA